MGLTGSQKHELTKLVNAYLDYAEGVWRAVGDRLAINAAVLVERELVKAAIAIPSEIPGHPVVDYGEPKVDDFVAFVLDQRDSTDHLMKDISPKTAKVTGIQRVYYETSALLHGCAQVVAWRKGKVTEFLGDGFLALYNASHDLGGVLKNAYWAAEESMEAKDNIVNPVLKDRYGLPPLTVGIGMAFSSALVTLVGLPNYQQPKVIGQCVYRATKLSQGNDQIHVDEAIRVAWPTAKGGRLRFLEHSLAGVKGYRVCSLES